MASRTKNSLRQWSVQQTSSKERIHWWESTPIESKQIGEQRDDIRKTTRTLTKSLPTGYDPDRCPSAIDWPHRTEDLTVWKRLSPAPPIQMSSRIATSFNHSSHNHSKGSEENHISKRARNTKSNCPFPRQPKHRSPTSQSRTRMIYTLQRLVLARALWHLEVRRNMHTLRITPTYNIPVNELYSRKLPRKPCFIRRQNTNQMPALLE